MSIKILEKSQDFIIYSIPLGKPNTEQTRQLGEDKRDRVLQKAYKGNTCWNYTFKFITPVIVGKKYVQEFQKEREFELLSSKRRKEKSQHETALPFLADYVNTNQSGSLKKMTKSFAEQLFINKELLKSYEAGGPSLEPSLNEFIDQNKHDNLCDFFLEKKYQKRIDIDIDFLKKCSVDHLELFEKLVTPQNGYHPAKWSNLNLISKNGLLDFFVRRITSEKCGLKVISWRPCEGIDQLIHELIIHGPIAVGGCLGREVYIDDPYERSEKIQGRTIYAWQSGAKRKEGVSVLHSILIIGAKKVEKQALVYFIDCADKSDPKDLNSQKIYVISYNNLITHISDNAGRIKKDSSLEIGYGYHGRLPEQF